MITLGTNDAADSRYGDQIKDPENFKSNVEAIISRHRRVHALAKENNSNIQDLRFVLVSIPDWYSTNAGNDTAENEVRGRISQYADKLREISNSNSDVGFIDMYNKWKDSFSDYDTYHPVFVADEDLGGSNDDEGVHPTTRGGSEFAEGIWEEVKKAAGEA